MSEHYQQLKNTTNGSINTGRESHIAVLAQACAELFTTPSITSDPNHAIYMQQLALQEKMAAELKDMRADIKRTAEKLEKAHPESESIKHSFRIAFV